MRIALLTFDWFRYIEYNVREVGYYETLAYMEWESAK